MTVPITEIGVGVGGAGLFALLLRSLLTSESHTEKLSLHWRDELVAADARCEEQLKRLEERYDRDTKRLETRIHSLEERLTHQTGSTP